MSFRDLERVARVPQTPAAAARDKDAANAAPVSPRPAPAAAKGPADASPPNKGRPGRR